VEDELVVILES